MLTKLLAIGSAALLVGAVAIGTLGPPDMTLNEALMETNGAGLEAVHRWVWLHLSPWLWDHPVRSILARPAWLAPAALGLVLAGAAMTVINGRKPTATRRRRS